MSSEKLAEDIGYCVRQNWQWHQLPVQIQQKIFQSNQVDYNKYIINYSLKNQIRYRGNLVAKVYRHERRYYELLVQKSVHSLGLFPYHLADVVTKGLRVTPFNYYVDVLSQLLRNDKSYDTLPNFTAADCLRVLGIGRNEYLSLISELKTTSSRGLLFSYKTNPLDCLPRVPRPIRIEPWWRLEIGNVLETDIVHVDALERALLDDLIDFGPQEAGTCDLALVHGLYRKGLIYLDVPISSMDRICIPPLKNFVMNRVSGDYFENLMYKIFVSADEMMTIEELAQMLQVSLEGVKQAVSLLCRLGFARRQDPPRGEVNLKYHPSWKNKIYEVEERPQITPLNYNSLMADAVAERAGGEASQTLKSSPKETKGSKEIDSSSISYLSSDGNNSDFSFAPGPSPSAGPSGRSGLQRDKSLEDGSGPHSDIEDLSDPSNVTLNQGHLTPTTPTGTGNRSGQRVGFLFDSTLTAFLMMGNLSPGLKNHAVTMFEVGKLCEESMSTFLTELEQVSLLDAEGEGDVSRYFAHAVILRSTICALRHLLPGGLDLLRIECLESLDYKTRDRVLDKKYKFLISAAPLTTNLSHLFNIPFFGQFYRSSSCSHMWTKLFYNHLSGYGPPSLFLCRGTVLKSLPRLFLGYGKLLVNVLHSDSYIINSSHFLNINEQLKNGCVLIQGYGITKPGDVRYEAFPFDEDDQRQQKWSQHQAIRKLREHIELKNMCGYITFLNTGVTDLGCENHDVNVKLKSNKKLSNPLPITAEQAQENRPYEGELAEVEPKKITDTVIAPALQDLLSPTDSSEVTSFARLRETPTPMPLKSVDENYFVVTPKHKLPSQIYASQDCNEILAKELASCGAQPAQTEANNNDNNSDVDSEVKQEEEWTLLDVHFGVPLFDVDCNTRICQRIVDQLCNEENLNNLNEYSNKMNAKLLEFVRQCLYFEDESPAQLKIGKNLPLPRLNLAFENGRVGYWNGR